MDNDRVALIDLDKGPWELVVDYHHRAEETTWGPGSCGNVEREFADGLVGTCQPAPAPITTSSPILTGWSVMTKSGSRLNEVGSTAVTEGMGGCG